MKKLLVLSGAVALALPVHAVNLFSNQSLNPNVAALNFQDTTRSGVAAPAGSAWSEIQADGAGPQPTANTLTGFSVFQFENGPSRRVADDFAVAPGGWRVNGISVFGFEIGSSAVPINNGSLKIWSGRPGNTTSFQLFESTSFTVTDQLQLDEHTVGVGYRVRNTDSGSNPSTPDGNRRIWQVTFSFADIELTEGDYWIDYQLNSLTGLIFSPSTTHQNQRGVAGANARQLFPSGWTNLVDAGTSPDAGEVHQEIPFIVHGEPVPEPGTMAALGLGLAALLKRRRLK